MVSIKNDSLLKQKFFGEKLNIALCLIGKNKNIKSAPRVFSPKTKRRILKTDKQRGFIALRDFYQKYLCAKYRVRLETLKEWLSSNFFPVSFIRAVSLLSKEDNFFQKSVTNKVLIYNNKTISLPLTKKQLLNTELAYLCGVIFGDGYISKNLIKINDGHHKEENLQASKEFLEYVGGLFYKLFGKSPAPIRRRDHQFELLVVSRPISKFVTIFLEVPLSPKKRLRIPSIYKKNRECLRAFVRGLFDTDGHIHEKYNYLTFKSADADFTREVRKALIGFGLSPSEVVFDNLGISGIKIYSKDTMKFSKEIGFSHPRKQNILEHHIKRGTAKEAFLGFDNKSIFNKYFDITLIEHLRIKGFGEKLKKIRKKKRLTQQEFSQELNLSRKNYSRFETNELAAPLKLYEKVLKKKEILEEASKNNVKFGLRGHNFIKFKLKTNQIDKNIFEYLSPKKTMVTVIQRPPKKILTNKEIENKIEKTFGIKITPTRDQKIIQSQTLAKFLKTFCSYKNVWEN
ncbi:MAG TPA: LAGLIDADG family homing endonuclease [archaeon]|nr:LAGLIDADG family homing endonuclease [archaeon]